MMIGWPKLAQVLSFRLYSSRSRSTEEETRTLLLLSSYRLSLSFSIFLRDDPQK